MATHDYNLANASGASFRADLNNALAAIVTNNSNATSPATTYAYQWWADTTANQLKLRNSANDDWIVIQELDGTMLMEDGTAAAPGLAFADDTNTGLFRASSNKLGIATAGVERVSLSATQTVFNDSGADVNLRIEGDGDPNLFFVDAGTNQVGIGTGIPTEKLELEDAAGARIAFTDTGLKRYTIGNAGTGSSSLRIRDDTLSADRLVITHAGNTGIGTSSPAGKLNIDGSATTPSLTHDNDDILNLDVGGAQIAFGIDSTSPFGGFIQARDDGNTSRVLGLNPAGGAVGIGTDAPSETLVIKDDGPVIRLHDSDTVLSNGEMSSGIEFYQSDSSGAGVGASIKARGDGSTGRLVLAFATDNNTEQMRLELDGKLVLGGITPATNIDHSLCTPGRIESDATYSVTTSSSANVNISADGLLQRSTSSAKYKTNIETLEDSYADAVLNARPVWFNSTASEDTAHPEWGYWGFIAEEIHEIDQRLVFYREDDDGNLEPEGVQYDRFIPHLVNLVKRQKEQIEALTTRIEALEAA